MGTPQDFIDFLAGKSDVEFHNVYWVLMPVAVRYVLLLLQTVWCIE